MDIQTHRMLFGAAGAGGGPALPEIGAFYEGGYFAGLISASGNGVASHGLIVSPRSEGYNNLTGLRWKASNTSTFGTLSRIDGPGNTASMEAFGPGPHPASNYCAGLTINGYSDWYLPARDELEVAYYNLKPTTASNSTASYGNNPYAIPTRNGFYYTTGNPPQTPVAAFQQGGSEAFEAGYHWSSTEESDPYGYRMYFLDGTMSFGNKTLAINVRAFRRFAL